MRQGALRWLAPAITGRFTIALMLFGYCAVWLAQGPQPNGPSALAARAGAAIAAFFGWGLIMAAVFWQFDGTGYPCFLWWGRQAECARELLRES